MEGWRIFMPLLSIILPVFNGEQTIAIAIRSVLEQTLDDWELIIINDGSSDKTRDICKAFLEQSPRIFYYAQKNKGLSAARNAGIEKARGEYLAFLDADDWVEPEYYQGMLLSLEKQSVDLVLAGYTREFWRNGKKPKKVRLELPYCRSEIEEFFFDKEILAFSYDLFIHVWNKLYKTHIINEHKIMFCENTFFAEDVPFNVAYLNHCRVFCTCPSMGYHYICRGKNTLTAEWRNDLIERNNQVYRDISQFVKTIAPHAEPILLGDMYLRGCFLNIEKAISAEMPYAQTTRIINEILNENEVNEVLSLASPRRASSLEFSLYRFFMNIGNTKLILGAVHARRWIKRVMGRI